MISIWQLISILNENIEWHHAQIELNKNMGKIGENFIENMFVNMVLKEKHL
jgi:hypothetical protein